MRNLLENLLGILLITMAAAAYLEIDRQKGVARDPQRDVIILWQPIDPRGQAMAGRQRYVITHKPVIEWEIRSNTWEREYGRYPEHFGADPVPWNRGMVSATVPARHGVKNPCREPLKTDPQDPGEAEHQPWKHEWEGSKLKGGGW